MKEKFKTFCKKNLTVFIYIILAISLEIAGICFADCSPYFTNPLYFIALFGTFISMLFIFRSKQAKMIVAIFLLLFQGILNILMVFIYDANGTYFEWEMINQRTDGMTMIEDLELHVGLCITVVVMVVFYIFACLICNDFLYKKKEKYKMGKAGRITTAIVLGVCALLTVFIPSIDGAIQANNSYVKSILYGNGDNRYQQVGITSNSVYELFNGTIADSVREYSLDGVEEYIYDGGLLEQSPYFGISEENNLVVVLVETFEWYIFLNLISKEQSLELYPNLNKFMQSSLVADNYYSREKTDCSEILLLLGTNPANGYVNYDFNDNSYPQSLVNMFKSSFSNSDKELLGCNYFHQNTSTFYNRDKLMDNVGFDNFYSIEKMEEFGVENLEESLGECTLDSETAFHMQDKMFPQTEKNEQYMSFWMTYSMHGGFFKRQSFEDAGYYDKLDSLGVFASSRDVVTQELLRTYAAAVMDFDKAVGIMMDKLEGNGQLDNTTIVMCADHNSYYNGMSGFAKGINQTFHSELYRVPFMIYDNKLKDAYVQNNGTNVISKFTCGQDVLPTILDIFGIAGYKNLYFGTSMFVENVEGVVYSRSYGIFVTDKLVCHSVNNLLYTCEGFNEQDKQDFIDRATIHLTKLEYMDKIYHNDYFSAHPYIYPRSS